MADRPRQGFGTLELVLVGVALCVMVALGIFAASAITQSASSGGTPTPAASPAALALEPVKPDAVAPAPVAAGDQVAQQWVRDLSTRTGISETAMRAYASAVLRIGQEQPACRLGWSTLAAIGGIESGHGTEGGAYLLPDGRTSQPILGPALDGTNGFAAIRSTAESVPWHGDLAWDHAVGPMQFIPSTWERWESDGNKDGVNDPSNIFDAAYAAGRYLCTTGDLSTGTGWSQAVFSYNHSEDYVRSVLAFANDYATRGQRE
ncbi:lytic transglycosylase domain-containing protein [Aeromicrobium wangtongii]|uniref:Lytic transglycosylase domain-containing protein n=1 Tax=Aeromicrobium wangtongii TaxID=2969247 RepID=A0ABY5MC11_9ACTN|nr:lytic transglycosylase domain-containing protein [Aeromicrobium wangtongii]MCD9197888.1 lytic transglycosylase domain-containing protein [Aeromicrobium wangtongii]UUP15367.1 lytic transglycosylase domain-containing protein [Aeromicrobium wangtongii]